MRPVALAGILLSFAAALVLATGCASTGTDLPIAEPPTDAGPPPALTAELPVCLLSASISDKEKAQAAELGATKFIEKPFDPAELGANVIELLESMPHDDTH